MKVVEILKLGRIWLEMLQDSCINVQDVRFIDLYDDYVRIVSSGNKKSYAVACLAQKYNISERKVYYIISKFGRDCKFGAV